MRYVYSFIIYIVALFIPFYLSKRGKKNPAYYLNWNERFGIRLKNDSLKPIIWLHAVSVGETRAMSKLVELLNINYPQYQLLITQMTPTGRATAKQLYPQARLHYVPYDIPFAVKNFYKTFKPTIGIIMETEIWPNLIHYAKQSNIPLFLVNARLSDKSCNGYRKIKFFIEPTINKLTKILCQDLTTQRNFKLLGYNKDLPIIGSTKFDLTVDVKQAKVARELKAKLESRKVVIFASTRDGEEKDIIDRLGNKQYFTIIVPRHPERFSEVEDLLIDRKIKYIKRSDNLNISDDIEVLLGDSMGEMAMYYSLSDLAVIGGSLNNKGGQNLIEPLFLNKPTIFGKGMFNFAEIAANALKDNCAYEVATYEECFKVIDKIINDEVEYNSLKNSCTIFIKRYQGASQKIIDEVTAYL